MTELDTVQEASRPSAFERFGQTVTNLPPAVRRPLGSAFTWMPSTSLKLLGFVLSPEVRAEPWALYRQLRQRSPVLNTPFGIWLVSSHHDVATLARHPSMSVEERHSRLYAGNEADTPFMRVLGRSMLFVDPPDHDRMRRLVVRSFTPRRVELLRPRVEELARKRLDRVAPRGRADLLAELAYPLPVDVICDLLGVPEADRHLFPGWAADIAARFDIQPVRTPEINERGDRATTLLAEYLRTLAADPSRRLSGGLIDDLVTSEGERLTEAEVVSVCALLLMAGHETTANLLGNGLLALFRHPDQLEDLRSGRVSPETAVEELLRFAGPVQMTQRITLAPVEVSGLTIGANELVVLLLAGANRDPSVFEAPDELRLDRDPNPHVAFSSGLHACLGAALARLETAVVLRLLLDRFPKLRLDGKPRWRNTYVLRGLQSLPVAWD